MDLSLGLFISELDYVCHTIVLLSQQKNNLMKQYHQLG